MTADAALDVYMDKTAICPINAEGKIVLEAVTISDPERIARCLAPQGAELELVGFEAGPLSEWLFRGLQEEGGKPVLMETRQVRAAGSAMVMKTDRNDARGMAQLLRSGWFRPVHVKTISLRASSARCLPHVRH